MARSIPSDLIRKIQVKLREGAGLPNYDPSMLLSFCPPVDEAGRRIYPPSSSCPDFIIFNTTDSCRRLLKSLDLDGSEVVYPNAQLEDSRKDNKVGDGIILHDYLNIKIHRRIEGEIDQKITTDSKPAPSTYTVNLSGIDLDDYFSDAKKDTNISLTSDFASLDFFEKSEPTKPSEKVNPVTTWDVDFPVTDSHPSQDQTEEKLKDSSKLDSTSGAWDTDDLWPTSSSSINLNAPKSQGETAKNMKISDKLDSSSDAWNMDDLWPANSSSIDVNATKIQEKTEENVKNPNKLDSSSEAWNTDDLWHASSSNVTANALKSPEKIEENLKRSNKLDSSSDAWNVDDLWSTSSSSITVNAPNGQEQTEENLTNSSKLDSASETWNMDDLWLTSSSSITANAKKSQEQAEPKTSIKFDSESEAWNMDDLWPASNLSVTDNAPKSLEQTEEKLKNSMNLDSTNETWNMDDVWLTSSASVTVNAPKNQEDDDLYDDWQDFTGSKTVNLTSNVWPNPGLDPALPKDSVDLEDMDFGDFVQSGADSSQQNPSQTQDLFFSGMNGWDEVKVATSADPTPNIDNDFLSQMHNLSFLPREFQPSNRAL